MNHKKSIVSQGLSLLSEDFTNKEIIQLLIPYSRIKISEPLMSKLKHRIDEVGITSLRNIAIAIQLFLSKEQQLFYDEATATFTNDPEAGFEIPLFMEESELLKDIIDEPMEHKLEQPEHKEQKKKKKKKKRGSTKKVHKTNINTLQYIKKNTGSIHQYNAEQMNIQIKQQSPEE